MKITRQQLEELRDSFTGSYRDDCDRLLADAEGGEFDAEAVRDEDGDWLWVISHAESDHDVICLHREAPPWSPWRGGADTWARSSWASCSSGSTRSTRPGRRSWGRRREAHDHSPGLLVRAQPPLGPGDRCLDPCGGRP